jgi:hypothetical protein
MNEQEKKSKLHIEKNTRPSFTAMPSHISSMSDPNDYIEITEWSNGGGIDINMGTKGSGLQNISIHYQEWRVIKKIMKTILKS